MWTFSQNIRSPTFLFIFFFGLYGLFLALPTYGLAENSSETVLQQVETSKNSANSEGRDTTDEKTISIFKISLLIVLTGAFGGFVFGLVNRPTYKFRWPFSKEDYEFGSLGDAIVGSAASLAIFLVAGALFSLNVDQLSSNADILKIMSIGIISGFAGIQLLAGMSSRLIQQVSEASKKMEMIDENVKALQQTEVIHGIVDRADKTLRDDNKPDEALLILNDALEIDPVNDAALFVKAKALRAKDNLEEAIQVLNTILSRKPNAPRALYNRACYMNLAGTEKYTKDMVLADLKNAASSHKPYKVYARTDPDFESLFEDKEFIALTKMLEENQ